MVISAGRPPPRSANATGVCQDASGTSNGGAIELVTAHGVRVEVPSCCGGLHEPAEAVMHAIGCSGPTPMVGGDRQTVNQTRLVLDVVTQRLPPTQVGVG